MPKIVTWRCRNAEGRLTTHTGLVRSSSDASNTTVHAVRMPPARLQESTGHTKVVWSLAIRNATPHDASTSLVPGITEGIAHLHARPPPASCAAQQPALAARVVERVKQQTKRAACDGALDVTLTGVARSFVVHARQARGWRVAAARGQAIAESMRAAHEAAREAARGTPR